MNVYKIDTHVEGISGKRTYLVAAPDAHEAARLIGVTYTNLSVFGSVLDPTDPLSLIALEQPGTLLNRVGPFGPFLVTKKL